MQKWHDFLKIIAKILSKINKKIHKIDQFEQFYAKKATITAKLSQKSCFKSIKFDQYLKNP